MSDNVMPAPAQTAEGGATFTDRAPTFTFSPNLERFILGAAAIMTLNLAAVLIVVSLLPLLYTPILGFVDLTNINGALVKSDIKPITAFRGSVYVSCFLLLLFCGPIRLCLWGARQYLDAKWKGAIAFSVCWGLFIYFMEWPSGTGMAIVNFDLVAPCTMAAILLYRWRSVLALKESKE